MVASVPEETMRTISMEGMSSQTLSAICVSIAVGAPNESPLRTTASTASITSWWAWPRIMGPHEPT